MTTLEVPAREPAGTPILTPTSYDASLIAAAAAAARASRLNCWHFVTADVYVRSTAWKEMIKRAVRRAGVSVAIHLGPAGEMRILGLNDLAPIAPARISRAGSRVKCGAEFALRMHSRQRTSNVVPWGGRAQMRMRDCGPRNRFQIFPHPMVGRSLPLRISFVQGKKATKRMRSSVGWWAPTRIINADGKSLTVVPPPAASSSSLLNERMATRRDDIPRSLTMSTRTIPVSSFAKANHQIQLPRPMRTLSSA